MVQKSREEFLWLEAELQTSSGACVSEEQKRLHRQDGIA